MVSKFLMELFLWTFSISFIFSSTHGTLGYCHSSAVTYYYEQIVQNGNIALVHLFQIVKFIATFSMVFYMPYCTSQSFLHSQIRMWKRTHSFHIGSSVFSLNLLFIGLLSAIHIFMLIYVTISSTLFLLYIFFVFNEFVYSVIDAIWTEQMLWIFSLFIARHIFFSLFFSISLFIHSVPLIWTILILTINVYLIFVYFITVSHSFVLLLLSRVSVVIYRHIFFFCSLWVFSATNVYNQI